MNAKQYTLDRFDGDYAIFLKRPEELEQLFIHRSQIYVEATEGDLVEIQDHGAGYIFTVLKNATEKQKTDVANLLDQLKNRKNK